MIDVPVAQLVGEFEEVESQDDKIRELKAQIKALNADNSERFNDIAKEYETDAKSIRKAYDFWVRAKEAPEPELVDDDIYSLISALSVYLTDDNEA